MVKKVCFVSMFAFLFLFLSNIAEAQNMKEGLWQITMTMEMPGIPMQRPPQSYTHCLTKKDMVPQKEEPNQECRMVKRDIEGDTVTWVMKCQTEEGITVLNGKVTYNRKSFEGVIKMKQSDMEMTQNLKGKWIGECK